MKSKKEAFLSDAFYILGLFGMLLSSMMAAVFPMYSSWIFSMIMLIGIILRPSKRYFNKIYFQWIMVYLAFFALSSLWALSYTNVLGLILLSLLPILIACITTMLYLCNGGTVKTIILVYFISSMIMMAYVLMHVGEFLEAGRFGSSLNEDSNATEWNANAIGMTLCYGIFAGWILFMGKGKKRLFSFAYLVLTVGILFLILMSGSRKVILMLMIPIMYFALLKKSKYRVVWITVGIAVMIGGYNLVMNYEPLYYTMGYRIEELVNILTGHETGTEDSSRRELIKYGFEWFQDRPILGYGLNCYRRLSNATSMFAGRNFYAHNNYVELLVDVGIVGLLIYYWAYIYIYIKLRTIILRIGHEDNVLSWGKILFYILVILDTALVSYYDFVECLVICILFYIIYKKEKEIHQAKLKIIKRNN